jgi:branched-chain amino acid transport system substrate-binding protein
MRLSTTIIFILFYAYSLFGQEIPRYNKSIETKFQEGLTAFEKSDYRTAESVFEQIIRAPLNQRTTASYLMLAKTFIYLHDFKQTKEILNKFLEKFPESNYTSNANYTLGTVYRKMNEYVMSFIAFARVLEYPDNIPLGQRAISHLGSLTKNNLNIDKLSTILRSFENTDVKVLINILIAQKYFDNGDIKKSKTLIDSILSGKVNSKYQSMALNLKQLISEGLVLKIGALFPLMHDNKNSVYREIGEDIANGAQIAIDEFNSKSRVHYKFELEIRDTEKNPSKAAKKLEELAKDEDVIGIVGPVFSDEAQKCAEVSGLFKIPTVSPTATGGKIAEASVYSFQANPDFVNRGKSMALYAVKQLGLVQLAVLSCDEPSSRGMSESFINEVEKIGGHVIRTEWYAKGSTDLTEQLKNIRSAGLIKAAEPLISFSTKLSSKDKMKLIRAGVAARFVDSLIEIGGSAGVYKLFGIRGKHIADSLRLKYTIPVIKTDSLDIPVTSIHGIFIPISSPEEIGVVTSQINFYNIRTQILGTSEWYDEVELDQHSGYTEGTIFLSEFYLDNSQPSVGKFLGSYSEKFSRTPSRYSFFGYDAVDLILNQIKSLDITRETLQIKLSSVKSFSALHSKISLAGRRINSELNILKYSKGSIIKIGEVNVEQK